MPNLKKDYCYVAYYAQRDEADRVASSNMSTTQRKTCINIGSSVVRALVAKTKGSGFKSLPNHAVPFFYRVVLHLFIKLRALTRNTICHIFIDLTIYFEPYFEPYF